ncbi:MAG: 30S ribosome-binding factor RbfA [Synergistaceae bacterium]|nr:30S ribosome-binding factor RbfA [Synergistaceae bacterium]
MVTLRIKKINKEFLRSISVMLQCRIKNDVVKDAILTKVLVSRDLGFAKVFYTLIDVSAQETLQQALDLVSGQIRSILGKEMHLRKIPVLNFVYDDSEAKAREMDALLDRVAAIDAERVNLLKCDEE